MSAPAEICDSCGKTITDEQLESGSAIFVLGRGYCPDCKGEAVKDISLDDLSSPPEPPPKAAPKPAVKSALPPASTPRPAPAKGVEVIRLDVSKEPPPQATPRTVVAPRAGQRRAAARSTGSKKGLLIAFGAAGAAALAVAILLATRGGGPGKQKPDPIPVAEKPPTPPPVPTAEEKAEEAYRTAITVSRRAESSVDEVLAAIDRAAPVCRGTKYEAELEKIRNGALRDREQTEAGRSLQPLLEELRSAVASDTGFRRFAEIQDKFQKARELASRSASNRIGEINQLQQDYGGRYEKAADPHLKEIEFTAQVLADDRRYDEALAKIETFPRELRQSGAWKSLDILKKDIERKRKLFPPKK